MLVVEVESCDTGEERGQVRVEVARVSRRLAEDRQQIAVGNEEETRKLQTLLLQVANNRNAV